MRTEWGLVLLMLLAAIMLAVSSSGAATQDNPPVGPAADPLPEGALLRIGSARSRPSGTAQAVAFRSDNGRLVSIDLGTGIHVWDVKAGKELLACGRLAPGAAAFAVSADGTLAALVESSEVCRIYDTDTGQAIRSLHAPWSEVRRLCLSNDKKLLASVGKDMVVRVWDLASGALLKRGETSNSEDWREPQLVFSPDGKKLAFGWRAPGIMVWDLASGQQSKIGTSEGSHGGLAFSPDGTTLAALDSQNRHFALYESATGKLLLAVRPEEGPCWCLAFAPDGKSLATGNHPAKICVWDVGTGKLQRVLQGNLGEIDGLTFSADGKRLATGSGGCTLCVWDYDSGKLVQSFAGPHAALIEARFGVDGKTIVSICDPWFRGSTTQGCTLRVWDLATGLALRQIDRDPAKTAAWCLSADGSLLATADTAGKFHLQNLVTGKIGPAVNPSEWPIHALHLSGDSRFLAAVALEPLQPAARVLPRLSCSVWDAVTGKLVIALKAAEGEYLSCQFTDDGRYLAVHSTRFGQAKGLISGIGPDQGLPAAMPVYSVTLWDLRNGQQIRRPSPPLDARAFGTFSPSGRLMAVQERDSTFVLRELASGKIVNRLIAEGGFSCIAFAPNGKNVALGTRDGSVLLWDIVSQKALSRLPGHHGHVACLSFSADGKRLLSGGADTTIVAWDVSRWTKNAVTPVVALGVGEAAKLWNDLAAADPSRAYAGILRFLQAPKDSLVFLRQHLQQAKPVDGQEIARAIEALDSNRYAEREEATTKLHKMGFQALPALEKVLAGNPPLEVLRRVELLVSKIGMQPAPADWLQALRALEVVEMLGTPDAVAILEALARGAPEGWLTQEAAASLDRVRKRLAAGAKG